MSAPQTRITVISRLIGILLFLTIVCGAFGEMYVPSRLLTADAATTAANLREHESLFRIGFLAYLVEAFADVVLCLLFYVLLRPVNRNLALLSAFLGIVSMTLFAVAEMFYFSAPHFLTGGAHLAAFSTQQLEGLAFHFLKLYGLFGALFILFYGSATFVRGYLMFRSGYLPRALGVLVMAAGTCFILKNVTLVLVPAHSHMLLLLPMFVAMLSVMAWMLFKGVDEKQWNKLNQPTN